MHTCIYFLFVLFSCLFCSLSPFPTHSSDHDWKIVSNGTRSQFSDIHMRVCVYMLKYLLSISNCWIEGFLHGRLVETIERQQIQLISILNYLKSRAWTRVSDEKWNQVREVGRAFRENYGWRRFLKIFQRMFHFLCLIGKL